MRRRFEATEELRMAVATAEETTAQPGVGELTDGFHLVIEALKLNGIETIYQISPNFIIPAVLFLRTRILKD